MINLILALLITGGVLLTLAGAMVAGLFALIVIDERGASA
jgi:hypothetical protein